MKTLAALLLNLSWMMCSMLASTRADTTCLMSTWYWPPPLSSQQSELLVKVDTGQLAGAGVPLLPGHCSGDVRHGHWLTDSILCIALTRHNVQQCSIHSSNMVI